VKDRTTTQQPPQNAAAQRGRAAHIARLRAYADMLDKHPEIDLQELPMPDTGPLVTASYLEQLRAAAEFLEDTGVPVGRYGSITIYWHADSADEVDRIAELGALTPEWSKDSQQYKAVQSFGPNVEYTVTYRKPVTVPATAKAPEPASLVTA